MYWWVGRAETRRWAEKSQGREFESKKENSRARQRIGEQDGELESKTGTSRAKKGKERVAPGGVFRG
jgi:hypothetical protein